MNVRLVAEMAGLIPHHSYSLYLPIAAMAAWALFLPAALCKKIGRFYNGSLQAAFYEEVLFRGVVYGGIRLLGGTPIVALVSSSLLFGMFHMRNLWWAGWRRSWQMTRYASFIAGPIFCIIRMVTGDIYVGILVHFLHNLIVLLPPPGLGRFMARTPTDSELSNVR